MKDFEKYERKFQYKRIQIKNLCQNIRSKIIFFYRKTDFYRYRKNSQ